MKIYQYSVTIHKLFKKINTFQRGSVYDLFPSFQIQFTVKYR